jgi:hypothetical protein
MSRLFQKHTTAHPILTAWIRRRCYSGGRRKSEEVAVVKEDGSGRKHILPPGRHLTVSETTLPSPRRPRGWHICSPTNAISCQLRGSLRTTLHTILKPRALSTRTGFMHPAAARPLVMQLRNRSAHARHLRENPLRRVSHNHYARDNRRGMVTSRSSRWAASPVPEDRPRVDHRGRGVCDLLR